MFGDVPVMVTFFISSSVCRHCKTTYDVFGVLLLNLRKCGYQTRFLFYQLRGLSASASGLNTSPGPIIFSCMENHVWSLFSHVLLTCVCTICIIHYTIMQRVFFFWNNFASLRPCHSFSLVYIMIMCAVHIVNALIKQCSKLSCSFCFVIFIIIIISVV